MSLPASPMPKASAQVAPFVECLGPELAMQFLLRFGGAELYISANPQNGGGVEALVGREAMGRMVAHHRIGNHIRRVPLARRWLALMLHWQGYSTAQIARTLRATDVTVRNYISAGRVA
ncbi:terminase gpP N-terminus-related DNA-binding protein [Pseudogemmobacter bohemicus]|uniref:terminase gpP N-terminus-related DNA-binding protein n=1 Tax=Pseudogemmobacter bohemicus TaxID=2250708 RepID=UPI000DD2C8C4|nr:sigma factor-like helix-turn-helix DNA-binding protein [Pseudogemmobacter bohemicus]